MEHLDISFEFFPPKSPQGFIKLQQVANKLQKTNPTFFSVTFGAGGSTREGTVETVKMLKKNVSTPVAPHLACIGLSRAELISLIQGYKEHDISHLVVLRGDLPSGMGPMKGEIKYASDLVRLVREVTGDHFFIDVAAYPEGHPKAPTIHFDIANLHRKYEAGANRAITQYFFNPDAYFYFVDECIKNQIQIPIIPGIMPISQFTNLMRFSTLCGAEIPLWIRRRLEAYGDDVKSIRAFGIEVVYHLCEQLINGGAPGLHFYTLNQADLSLKLWEKLKVHAGIATGVSV